MTISNQSHRHTVVVTGSTGLIGRPLCKRLSNTCHVIGLDFEPSHEEFEHFEELIVDLTDDDAVKSTMETVRDHADGKLASVVHLAAYYDFSGQESPLYDELTVQGTKRLINALQKFDAVDQFIFSSTLLVMEPDKDPIDESDSLRAEWPYPQSKLETERIIGQLKGPIPSAILRIAGVYDESCRSWPLSRQIARIYEKQLESFVFPGNRNHGTSCVHLEDLVEAILKTIDARHKLSREEVFLIAEPEVMSYLELQEQIGTLIHGKEWPTIRLPKMFAKAGAWAKEKLAGEEDNNAIQPWMIDLADDHYEAEIEKARSLLDWNPKHTLRGTLPEIIHRFNEDPVAFYEQHQLPLPEELRSKAERV